MEESLRQSIGEDALIIFSCSHTHYAPSLCNALGLLKKIPLILKAWISSCSTLVRNCRMSEDAQLTVSYQVRNFTGRPLPASQGSDPICSGRSSGAFFKEGASWQFLDL